MEKKQGKLLATDAVVCTEACSKRPPEVKREDAENVETTLDTTLGGATEREATYWWLTVLT